MRGTENDRNRWLCNGDEERLSLLVVSSFPGDAAQFCGMLGESHWTVLTASSLQQALALLDANPVTAVICERDLPDGCWKHLLHAQSRGDEAPLLIVTSRLADERLWVEVLSEGGFDVIPKPLCEGDVTWVLASASLSALRQQQQRIEPREGGLEDPVEGAGDCLSEKGDGGSVRNGESRTGNSMETVRPVVLAAILALVGVVWLVVLLCRTKGRATAVRDYGATWKP